MASGETTATLADTSTVVLGCLIFAFTWLLIAFERVPFLPIGRTAGALAGAALMVACRVISAEQVGKTLLIREKSIDRP